MHESGTVATLEHAPSAPHAIDAAPRPDHIPPPTGASPSSFPPRLTRTPELPPWACTLLLFTASVSVLTSHYLFMDGDDLLELWCDRVPHLRQLIHIQSALPLVIDPFFYHGLTFASVRLFGLNPLLLRLPSLLGFLIMQLCLFYFVRRFASETAAFFALAFPLATCAFGFTWVLRPYGVLLGLFGLAMLSWQAAARRQTHRTWALATLALAVAAAINTHYYGVLLLVPPALPSSFAPWNANVWTFPYFCRSEPARRESCFSCPSSMEPRSSAATIAPGPSRSTPSPRPTTSSCLGRAPSANPQTIFWPLAWACSFSLSSGAVSTSCAVTHSLSRTPSSPFFSRWPRFRSPVTFSRVSSSTPPSPVTPSARSSASPGSCRSRLGLCSVPALSVALRCF